MTQQVIVWTVLPEGIVGPVGPGGMLRLSVLVSPRLSASGAPTLVEFPAFLDWPQVVQSLRFTVHFVGGPSVPATPDTSTLNSEVWKALFGPGTTVRSYAYEHREQQAIRSFPAATVLADLKQRYQHVAKIIGPNPNALPDIRSMVDLFLPVKPNPELTGLLNRLLRDLHAIPPATGGQTNGSIALLNAPTGAYTQLNLFHYQTPDNTPPKPLPTPAMIRAQFDFHDIVSALGNYPELLPMLGLVIELTLPFTAGTPTGIAAGTVTVEPSQYGSAPNVRMPTVYSLDANGFRAAPRAGSDLYEGLLRVGDTSQFSLAQVDVDGAAIKLIGMQANLEQAFTVRGTIGTPRQSGTPTLRSAGLSLLRIGRAYQLAQTLTRNAQMQEGAMANTPPALYADDLVRGYAIDVYDVSTHTWRSLNLRDGTYQFAHAPGGKNLLPQPIPGEGFITLSATQQESGTSSDLYLHESLFRWDGWSLSAPRPISPLDPQTSKPSNPTNSPITQSGLSVQFTARAKSLPRLRFGHRYRMRARMVDLVGHAADPAAAETQPKLVNTVPEPYLRWEPVVAPPMLLRKSITGSPGESLGRLVIRSDVHTSVDAYFAKQLSPTYNHYAERHFLPPKISQIMAETHGMFDGPPPAGKTWYQVIVAKDVLPDVDVEPNPAHPDDAKIVAHPYDVDNVPLPYLPDPLAVGATFLGLPGYLAATPFKDPVFDGTWPEFSTFRLIVKGASGPGDTPAPPLWNAGNHTITVELPQANMVTVRASTRLAPGVKGLLLLGMWQWLVEAGLGGLWLQPALDGLVWLLTPFRELTLVHAVQHPLIVPIFANRLEALRDLGSTKATLIDQPMPISGKSTIKLDIYAYWHEPVDDLTQPGPVVLEGHAHLAESPVQYTDTTVVFNPGDPQHTQEFHDTKYRRVSYNPVATSRFREYFPFSDADLQTDPSLITSSNPPVSTPEPDPTHATPPPAPTGSGVIDVPNSARPLAPAILYAVPTFGWQTGIGKQGELISTRAGGGLRIYLERPWYSSGEGELLGVVLANESLLLKFRPTALLSAVINNTVDPSHITQWGVDPLWLSGPLPHPYAPMLDSFPAAVRRGVNLTIDEQPGVKVAVAGHDVSYDPNRRLWYCDIELDTADAYYPFVRLALARYQPISVANAHLSRIVLADFHQIAPNRTATVLVNKDPSLMRITVTGPVPYRTTNQIFVRLEQQLPFSTDPDTGWVPVPKAEQQLPFAQEGNIGVWSGNFSVPALSVPLPALRLVVSEYELYPGSGSTLGIVALPARRLVYAEVLDVLIPS